AGPHALAGIRIEPPPSDPFAAGTMRAATAAAEPPLEPPGMRDVFHGFRVGPYASGSVVGINPSSGVFVRPTKTKPAARRRAATVLSRSARHRRSRRKRIPRWNGSPALGQLRSFSTIGTPRNGPYGSSGADAAAIAFSNNGWITAFRSPLTFSMRA